MAKNEKTFNEQNMRKIIRILSGLSASQQQLAEQCINEYDPTRTYQKDNICFFNGSLYRAKTVTNGNEPSPESTYFEMLDGIEEEIWSAWYQDWQQLRYAIELKMQPVIERGLCGSMPTNKEVKTSVP